ncbi:hypothetical protein ACIQH5_11230 [Paenarthrobacter sp. NPDC091711]|uniref:hypothetical protein n=1 Tax=Paenarthrobacter sp. NPDC091711 TaxID=3364385 RepID=UPI003800C587
MDRLAIRLRDSIRPGLGSVSNLLELERKVERANLEACMRNVSDDGGSIVVTGEPDVGKSALSLRVLETMGDGGAVVASLSLRDLPASVSDFEEQLGGSSLDEVMTTGEAQARQLLLIDGSEAVLEGKGDVFRALTTAALKAGIGVIAVTRTDGARQVREDLVRASEVARISQAPVEHVVGPLSEEERRTLPSKFGVLARLNGDSRADWLLGRPGLVDALLRSGAVVEPKNVLCEAEVFSAVWRGLVRRDERRGPGMISAEDRENAALAVARRTLGLVAVRAYGTAVAELKSDGVLRIPNDPAFSSGDEFSTDLFRDFSLCRLFLTDGWGNLTEAGAPRWSIRAARLACQAYLLRGERHQSWSLLTREFGAIAEMMGSRWAEVPYEALLTLSDAESAIHELWTKLEEADYSGLRTLLRLAEQRYVQGTFGDPFALAPVVKAVFADQPLFNRVSGATSSGLTKVVRQVVLAWIRGLASAGWGQEELRQMVRDVVLEQSPPLYDEFAVELLATLGPDIDDRTEAWLRDVASKRPGNLHPAVESAATAISMSASHPNLLLDLAESYYIEAPDPEQTWGRMGLFDDGIRDLKHGPGLGLGVPQSAWYYGPFFRLLSTVPLDALAFINRMLNHATTFRLQRDTEHPARLGESVEPEGLWLDITGTGPRFYHGDSQVWAWYRGTGAGSHACMSALLALERFVDYLYEEAKVDVPRIFELLLEDCTNIAVPGLLFGFLTRHPDLVGDRLDAFLSHPEVWHFETARTTVGLSFFSPDADAENLTGAQRRGHTPHDTVGTMVVSARLRGDHERLANLANIGDQLVANARKNLRGASGEAEYIAMIEGWAAEFRFESYSAKQSDGGLVIEFERPEHVEKALAARNDDLQTTINLYGFQNSYSRLNGSPVEWAMDDLPDDLTKARSISERGLPQDSLSPEDGLVAVASAAVRAHAFGLKVIENVDLMWAAEAVMLTAENPKTDDLSHHGIMFPIGADRLAAVAVPLLLTNKFDSLGLDRQRLDECLRAQATSHNDEVRMKYAEGCEHIWSDPCSYAPNSGPCLRHGSAWNAAVASLADAQGGQRSHSGQRKTIRPLRPPFHKSLPKVDSDRLLVNHLRMPIACMVDASAAACLKKEIRQLWDPLWNAGIRGVHHSWSQGFDHLEIMRHEPITRRLIDLAIDGETSPLETHVRAFAGDASALHLLLESLTQVLTYGDRQRKSLGVLWPWVMRVALDAVGDGAALRAQRPWGGYAISAILPVPNPRSSDPDIDATLETCRRNWIQPDVIAEVDERWLRLAEGQPTAVDAIVKFSRSAAREWQASIALTWIEVVIGTRFEVFANRLYYLENWLTELRNLGAFTNGDAQSRYHRIVDGLAAAGDHGMANLQQLDE